MNSRKLFNLIVMAGLLLFSLLVNLVGLAEAAPAPVIGGVDSLNAVEIMGDLVNNSPAQTALTAKPGLALPSAVSAKRPLLLDTPVLTLTKSANPDPVTAGDVLTYTIVVANSITDATGIVITDLLDSNVTFAWASDGGVHDSGVVTWNVDTISVGGAITRTLLVTVSDVASGTILSNTAAVTSTEGGSDSDSVTTVVNTSADLALAKTDTTDPVVATFISFGYILTVTNNGPSDATSVILTDNLPAGMFLTNADHPGCSTPGSNPVVCNLGTITSGDGVQVILQITPFQPGVFTNQAEVVANEPDPNTEDNTATEDTTIKPVDLSITKTDSPDAALVGQPLTYSLTVFNAGPNDATGMVLTDTLPSGVMFRSVTPGPPTCNHAGGTVTCNLPTLTSLDTRVVTIVVTPTMAGTIVNTAGVTATLPDPNLTNNTATEETTVDPVTDLSISKSDDPDSVIAGEDLTYTLTVTNDGPSNATGVVVTDTLPAGVTFVSASGCSEVGGTVTCSLDNLASGDNAQVTIVVNVNSSTTGMLSNSASVRGSETDLNPTNNSTAEETTVETETDLEISKTDASDPVIAGEDLTYTLTVRNQGPSDASGVVVTDILPAGVTFVSAPGCSEVGGTVTCNLGNLARSETSQVTIVVHVDSSTTGTLSNSASVTGNETDPNGDNNSATESTTVNKRTDLAVTNASSPNPVLQGNSLTYNIVVANNGPSNATGVVLTDTLPSGVTFQSSVPGGPTCSESSGTVTCNLGSLASSDSIPVTIDVNVDSSATGPLSNSAGVRGSETDPNGENNTVTENTLVGEFFRLFLPIISKPAPTDLSIWNDNTGGNVTFTVIEAGVSCTVASGQVEFCGSFPPGNYNVQVISVCGPPATFPKTYGSGPVTTRVFCK